jgi:DNA-binding NarL/FixJ family response regulator
MKHGRGSSSRLTPRELEVLRLVAVGKTNKEIASQLCLSILTVQNHLHNIFRKRGYRTRTQAALHARDYDLMHKNS